MGKIRIRWILIAGALVSVGTSLAASLNAPFLSESDTAMRTMMAAMHITPSGDVDTDFVAMMVPHHQGAIDMAMAELRHGRNERSASLARRPSWRSYPSPVVGPSRRPHRPALRCSIRDWSNSSKPR